MHVSVSVDMHHSWGTVDLDFGGADTIPDRRKQKPLTLLWNVEIVALFF